MKRINVPNPSLHGKRVKGSINGNELKEGEIFFDGKDYYVLSNTIGWVLKSHKPQIEEKIEYKYSRGYFIVTGIGEEVVISSGVDLYLVGTSSYIPFL